MMSANSLAAARSLAAIALLFCLCTPSAATARRRDPPTGLRALSFAKAPPDFAYDDGTGAHRLAQLVGKPVVLNFWATWCEPCRAELDAFAALRATYSDTVALLTFSHEAPGVARAFLANRHVDLPLVEDPEHAIFDLYSVTALPVTVVLARDGTVAHVSVGEIEWSELHAAVDAALADSKLPQRRLTPFPASDTLPGNAGTQAP